MNAPEEQVVQRPSRRFRGRFSMRTLLLTMFVACLAGSHLQTSWRLKQANEELRKLRAEAGYLEMDDPRRIQAIQVPSVDSMTWRWRLYLPPGRRFELHLITKEVPPGGFPKEYGGTSMSLGRIDGEPFVLTLAVRKSYRGQWEWVIEQPGSSIRSAIEEDAAQWLTSSYGHSSTVAGAGHTQSFESDQPVQLLRLHAQTNPLISMPPRTGPTPGVLVWIQPR